MYLLATYTCECGCDTQLDESTTCKEIICQNCGKPAPKEISESVLAALHAMNAVPNTNIFSDPVTVKFDTENPRFNKLFESNHKDD